MKAAENTSNAQFKTMTFDVSTREGATAWLQRRVRKVGLIFLLGIPLSPVAAGIVVSIKYFRAAKSFPPLGPLVVSSLMWGGIMVALMGIVAVILAVKYLKIAKRVRPILDAGEQQPGSVVDVSVDSRRKGGVNLYKETLTVQTDSNTTVTVAIEVTEGTHLPKVEPGAPATIWSAGEQVVVGTSGAIFESVAA